jgi:hypothetical protein
MSHKLKIKQCYYSYKFLRPSGSYELQVFPSLRAVRRSNPETISILFSMDCFGLSPSQSIFERKLRGNKINLFA